MDVFVARQPIFDRNQGVVAYELLYRRSGELAVADVTDPDRATGEVLLRSLVDIGLDRLVGRHRAYVNFTRPFLTGEIPLPFDPERITLEVLESVDIDAEVVAGVRRLSREGYQIALDDFVFREGSGPLVEVADIVKLDVQAMDAQELGEYAAEFGRRGIRLLAEKVETPEQLRLCAEMGFELYQGFFFCKPAIIQGQHASSSRLATLQLLQQLNDPEISMDELARRVGTDVTLVYKLLRYINSAFFGLSREVQTIREALTMLGVDNIRRWLNLIALSQWAESSHALMVTTLARARMCELLARHCGCAAAPSAFMAGLFASVDAFMAMPKEEILDSVQLSGEIKQAVLHEEGPIGAVLRLALQVERGEWSEADRLGLDAEVVTGAYVEAIRWAEESLGVVSG